MSRLILGRVLAVLALAALACSAPFAQPTPTATPSPTPTSTPTPQPTRTPIPTLPPDVSQVTLTVDDLPSGFTPMPASDSARMESAFNDKGILTNVTAASFSKPTTGETVIALSGILPGNDSSNSFEATIGFPQILITGLATGMGSTTTNNLKDMDVHGIGDRSGGASADLTTSVGVVHVQTVIFRRGIVGVIVITAYRGSVKPVLSIEDLANLLDGRAQQGLKA